jgi:hypothetical protein
LKPKLSISTRDMLPMAKKSFSSNDKYTDPKRCEEVKDDVTSNKGGVCQWSIRKSICLMSDSGYRSPIDGAGVQEEGERL